MRVVWRKGKGWRGLFIRLAEKEGLRVETPVILTAKARSRFLKVSGKEYRRYELPQVPVEVGEYVVLPIERYTKVLKAWDILEAYKKAFGWVTTIFATELGAREREIMGKINLVLSELERSGDEGQRQALLLTLEALKNDLRDVRQLRERLQELQETVRSLEREEE